ncbi:hypothetical protein [Streptomyces sp. NPDC095602]|uniref:hypothetical protein n=1 Tax=Streptomyces sp. NPDC095602 TaxID=3155819 RepID=UPI003316B345
MADEQNPQTQQTGTGGAPQAPAPGTEQQPPQPGTDGTPQAQDTGGEAQLGDAGKKALAEERRARREAEARLKELEPLAAKARELEDASKSEAEKLAERAAEAERRAAEAELRALRLEVATAKGLTPTQAKRLVGATREELEADADDLLATFGGTGTAPTSGAQRRPVEQLRPGAQANPPEPTLAERIAAAEKAGQWQQAQQLKAMQLMQLAEQTK